MPFILLENFVTVFNARETFKEEHFENELTAVIKKVEKALLDERFLPSLQLKKLFEKLQRRAHYPMEIAVTGQFSSGKSTFLNALLQKDILPTGITPVTSKVNFINYGPEYRLKVSYLSGVEAFYPIEAISQFTDQRHYVHEVKYLTLYAPMEILKEISFVDTPGLNSLSVTDTATTQKVLRDVDGIIWLTLMDNAGKESEAQTLKEHLSHFKDKSLCLLNQKDKFTEEEIQTSCDYVRLAFSDYFSQVIPISAKQALTSRQHQKEMLIQEETRTLIEHFKTTFPSHCGEETLDFFAPRFKAFRQKLNEIEKADHSLDLKAQEDSNILKVIEFIEKSIRPHALESKASSIKRELCSICDILIKEYQTILTVYESLDELHHNCVLEMRMSLDTLLHRDLPEFYLIQEAVDAIVTDIAHEIFTHIIPQSKKRFVESKKSFTGSIKVEAFEYEARTVDREGILNALFFDDEKVDRKVLRAMKLLQNIEDETASSLRDIFLSTKTAIDTWRATYEYLDKQREIASDLEFANTRNFVSRVYENFLSFYHASSEESIAVMRKNFSFLKGAFSFNYRQVTLSSIAFFQTKIDQSLQSYEKDPFHFSLSIPTEDEILHRVQSDFSLEKIHSFLSSNRSYLHNIVSYAKNELDLILLSRTKYLKDEETKLHQKVEALEQIKASIEL